MNNYLKREKLFDLPYQKSEETISLLLNSGKKAKNLLLDGNLSRLLGKSDKSLSDINPYRDVLNKLFETDLSADEWLEFFKEMNYREFSVANFHSIISRIRDNRIVIPEITLKTESKLQDEEKRLSRLWMQESCERLGQPLSKLFSEKEIGQVLEITTRHRDEFHQLCTALLQYIEESCRGGKDGCFGDILTFYPDKPGKEDNTEADKSDDGYLEILRLFVRISDTNILKSVHKIEAIKNWLKKFCDLICRVMKDTDEILEPSGFEISDLSAETILLLGIWGAMVLSLAYKAWGDVDVDRSAIVLAILNCVICLLLVALSREGLPRFVDGGISKVCMKGTKSAYSFFHDRIKPISDWGIDYANNALDKQNIGIVICKRPSWNEELRLKIGETEKIPMFSAINMLHTFRIGDVFLNTILKNHVFGVDSYVDRMLQLSPIPCGEETSKLLSLFWGNPYDGDSELSRQQYPYGLFFNYEKEIEHIYDENLINVKDLSSGVSTGATIYEQIRLLNTSIGKGNATVFDDFLAYCIGGRIEKKLQAIGIWDVNQEQIAKKIYERLMHYK